MTTGSTIPQRCCTIAIASLRSPPRWRVAAQPTSSQHCIPSLAEAGVKADTSYMSSLARFSSALALVSVFTACAPSDEGTGGVSGSGNVGTGEGFGGGSTQGVGGQGTGSGGTDIGIVIIEDCGNGVLNDGELCDDANKDNLDGCNAACQIEVDWLCPTVGQACIYSAVCGDGSLSTVEACDDNNTVGNDGCAADCSAVEPGWQCRMPGRACIPLCGDAVITPPENCDDGNAVSGDGCSSTCLEEPGWSCVGVLCTRALCGNGETETGETCDAAAKNGFFFGDGTGCSKTCTQEPSCRNPTTGATQKCATVCGDANIDPGEACDDGNLFDGDGCRSDCTVESGFTCTAATRPDTTPCSSGNGQCLVLPIVYRDFDGANSTAAAAHPDFFFMGTNTACVPNASGVAATKTNGTCWTSDATDLCKGLVAPTLDSVTGKPAVNPASSLTCDCRFTDWDATGALTGVAGIETCNDEGGNSHPWISTTTQVIQSAASFNEWYSDTGRGTTVDDETIELAQIAGGNLYQYSSSGGMTVYDDLHDIFLSGSGTLASGFFPLDSQTGPGSTKLCNLWPYWVVPASAATCATGNATGVEQQWDPRGSWDINTPNGDGGPIPGDGTRASGVTGMKRNFYFTSEVRYLFRYEGGETLSFFGDDDVWVFINGQLALDLGAPHERLHGTVDLGAGTYTIQAINVATNLEIPVDSGPIPALGLEVGGTYQIAVFHADRHPRESNYQLTLSGFSTTQSECVPRCGDGVIATGEECDDGVNNADGLYGGCTTQCKFGPFCGDGIPDAPQEACDLGRGNVGAYGDPTGCGPACTTPHFCGDGAIDTAFGEECDDGGGSATCNTACRLTIT